MTKYCVSKGGTFGREIRRWVTLSNREMVLIEWGKYRWLTPVFSDDVHFFSSEYESDAREEAEKWLEEQEKKND